MTLASKVPVEYPLDSLVSFHYYRSDESMAPLVSCGRLRMIGDSGAFSALTQGQPINLAEYVAWCKRWGPYLCWFASLDVIGNPAATLRNWRHMRDVHGLISVPTLHVGTDPRWMDAYAREGCDFMGLGGMVGRALQSLPWLAKVFRYARDRHPQMRFHAWGTTHARVVDNLPMYSADSSGFGGGARFAYVRLFNPQRGRYVTLDLRPGTRDVYRYGRLLREYGVVPAEIERPTALNRPVLMQIAARAYQLHAAWLQQRHRVKPPTWGLQVPKHLQAARGAGTHLHAVAGESRGGPAHNDVLQAVDAHLSAVGTRLHAVTSAGGPGGVDDLERAVGTRLHAVSTKNDDLQLAAGTRLHAVDGNGEHLLYAVSTEEQS